MVHNRFLLPLVALTLTTNAPIINAAPGGSYSSPQPQIHGSCNTGPIQCCTHRISRSSPSFAALPPRLVAAGGTPSLIGLVSSLNEVHSGCSPMSGSVGGLLGFLGLALGGGSKCNTQPVCCSQNKFDGLVSIGCSPVSINLF